MLKKLHHVAYRCHDAQETVRFYTELLGLRFVAALAQEAVPSLSKEEPHNHIFFEMRDGSFIAFFDILNDQSPPGPMPDEWAQHLALEVDEIDAKEIQRRLKAAGVEVLGPVDHGICLSRYFRDPNGHRLEMAVRTDSAEVWNKFAERAPAELFAWQERKRNMPAEAL